MKTYQKALVIAFACRGLLAVAQTNLPTGSPSITPSSPATPLQALAPSPAATPAPTPVPAQSPSASPRPNFSPSPLPTASALPPPVSFEGASLPTGFFYYCASLRAYFPATPQCPEAWIAIPISGPVTTPVGLGLWTEPTPVDTVKEAVSDRPNTFSLELFGRALAYSVNLEHAFTERFSIGVGYSSWESTDWWDNYDATITVVPVYFSFYFSREPDRGFLSVGVDWIRNSEPGYDRDPFSNNGTAATIGIGYESRSNDGFLFRLAAYAIVGRTTDLSPGISVGYSF